MEPHEPEAGRMEHEAPADVMDDTTYQSLARFRYQLRLFQRFSEDAARAAGLTPSQHQLMLAIKGWWGPRPPTIGDLAELLQLKNHSTVELAKRTESTGMVRSRPDPSDRRRRQLTLTTAGERKLHDLSVLHRDEIRRFRSALNDVLGSLDR